MAKPPPSGPHTDLQGRDTRVFVPDRDPSKGTPTDLEQAEQESKGKPKTGEAVPKPRKRASHGNKR